MRIRRVEGIVVGEINYSESSKILKVFTSELGIISIISKGCKKAKSKFKEVSSKLSYASFDISYKEDGISTLICADVIDYFRNILSNYRDLEKRSYAFYITELTMQTLNEPHLDMEDTKNIYNLFIASLKKINEGLSSSIISNIIEIKYLEYLGVRPNIDCCSNCGANDNIVTFSSDSFGYVCNNCYKDEKKISNDAIKYLRMLYYVDINRINNLDIDVDVQREINMVIDEYYDRHTGIYLKTKDNLKNLHKLGVLA